MAAKGRRICSACGQSASPTASLSAPVCRNYWCGAPARPVNAVYSVGTYEGALRRAIVAYKYAGDLRWARPFASLLHGFLARHANWLEEYAVICPVPSYVGPGARREFGHVELLCSELGSIAGLEWPVQKLVAKVAETEPMSAKTHSVRHRIGHGLLSGAFTVAPGAKVAGRRILLVDDVCASGETLLAVARVLRGAGADEVSGLVLARASWHGPPGGAAVRQPRARPRSSPALAGSPVPPAAGP